MCNVRFVAAVASLTTKLWEVVVFLEVEIRILPARRLNAGKFRGLGNGANSTIAQNLLVVRNSARPRQYPDEGAMYEFLD